jgi:hypothetical protein
MYDRWQYTISDLFTITDNIGLSAFFSEFIDV